MLSNQSGREGEFAARDAVNLHLYLQHYPRLQKEVEMKTALERKFWQRMWGESPSSISGIEHRKPRPEASLSEVAQRGNHKEALKLCHSEILTHLAVGAVCATHKMSPKK